MTTPLIFYPNNNSMQQSCYETMKEEIFGPVLSIHAYQDHEFEHIPQLVIIP